MTEFTDNLSFTHKRESTADNIMPNGLKTIVTHTEVNTISAIKRLKGDIMEYKQPHRTIPYSDEDIREFNENIDEMVRIMNSLKFETQEPKNNRSFRNLFKRNRQQ